MTVGHLALIAAFAAGVVSFLWPCVFPLVPGYLSSIAGTTVRDVQGETAARKHVRLKFNGPKGPPTGDNSNAQFALLGLRAAEDAGIEVPAETWTLAHKFFGIQRFPGDGRRASHALPARHRQRHGGHLTHRTCGRSSASATTTTAAAPA